MSSREQPSRFRDWWLGKTGKQPHVLVLDGGVSTNLEKDNEPEGFAYRELWSSSLLLPDEKHSVDYNQARIFQGHKDWLQAGAHVVSTVSYQCHYCVKYWPARVELSESKMDEMWCRAVQLARSAIEDHQHSDQNDNIKPFLVASSGCFGASLANGAEYTGDYPPEATIEYLEQFHRRKLDTICHQQLAVDGVAFETVPSKKECQAIANVISCLDEVSAPCCYVSLSCRNDSELNDGTPLADVLEVFSSVPNTKLVALGLNCVHVKHVPGLLDTLVPIAVLGQQRGVVLFPNSGEEWNAGKADWEPGTGVSNEDEMINEHLGPCLEQIHELVGNRLQLRVLIGGCCRTTPVMIQRLRMLVDERYNCRD